MVPLSHVLAFAAVVSVVIAIPGPSVLFTISRALTVGRRAALLTVAGNELGLCVQVVAVAFGVGAVLERSAQILTAVKFAGAAYLVFLGVQAIRHRTSMAEALAARVQPVTSLRAIRDGFVVGVANPKSIVFFVVGLPEFTSSAPGHLPVPAQMLILGALFPVIALVLDSAWAAIADTARRWLVRSPRRLAMIGGTGGLVMIGLGISVAVTGRRTDIRTGRVSRAYTGRGRARIGVVVGCAEPQAGSTVRPSVSPLTTPDASTGGVFPAWAVGSRPAEVVFVLPISHSWYTLPEGSAGSPLVTTTS